MRLRIPIIASLAFTAVVSIVGLANLNSVNLLLNGSDYGDESSSLTQFNVNGEEEESYNPTVDGSSLGEALQSGLSGGGGGTGGLNLLWILQNAKDPDKTSYAYQLLEFYSNMESGKYNDYTYHIDPSTFAGSHYNESKLAAFFANKTSPYAIVDEGPFGQTVNGKVISFETANKDNLSGIMVKGDTPWVDRNKDGMPDGPFQIEQGNQADSNSNKLNGTGKYDMFNILDQGNVVDQKYNNVAEALAGANTSIDPRAIGALYGMYHNRGLGGIVYMLAGLPYDNDVETVKETDYIKSTSFENMESKHVADLAKFPVDVMKWFDAYNLPLESVTGDTEKARGLAALVILSKGGFIATDLSDATKQGIERLSNDIIGKVFPGQTSSTITAHINSTKVKKPWDALGMSKGEFDKVYGSSVISNQYEEIYRFNVNWYNTLFYFEEGVKSDIYKAGNHTLLRAIEGIAAGYIVDTGILGPNVLLNVALTAGIKSLTDGTIVDPTNPQTVYQKMAPESSGAFNPATAADGNFGAFMDYLGLTGTLSEAQQAQMKVLYDVSGGTYSQGKRGKLGDSGLYYLDCSAMASVGLHLKPGLHKDHLLDTAQIWNGKWLDSQGKVDYGGKSYDIRAVQLDLNGKPGTNTKVDSSWSQSYPKWQDKLITGDIIVVRDGSSGHVAMYGGKNTTGKDAVIPPDISKVKTIHSTIKAGEHFQMQSISTKYYNGLTGYWPRNPSSAPNEKHRVFRPVYNVR